MDNYKLLRFTVSLLLVLLIAGCGNKGDLYLPDSPPEAQQSEDDPSDEDGDSEA